MQVSCFEHIAYTKFWLLILNKSHYSQLTLWNLFDEHSHMLCRYCRILKCLNICCLQSLDVTYLIDNAQLPLSHYKLDDVSLTPASTQLISTSLNVSWVLIVNTINISRVNCNIVWMMDVLYIYLPFLCSYVDNWHLMMH